MKRREKITYVLLGATMLSFVGVCQAGFLHRTYQGSFIAHDHRYIVNTDGTIIVQTKEEINRYYPKLDWGTQFSFSNEEELKNVISDLQEVQKEIDSVNKEK